MKSLILSLILAASTQVFAGHVELGKYRAVDADTETIVATFELKADGTLTFSVSSPDFTMPAPGCKGTYKVDVPNQKFTADLTCPTDILPTVSVVIDTTPVNPQSIRTAKGAEVDVVIDALGEESNKFLLKKND